MNYWVGSLNKTNNMVIIIHYEYNNNTKAKPVCLSVSTLAHWQGAPSLLLAIALMLMLIIQVIAVQFIDQRQQYALRIQIMRLVQEAHRHG